MVVRLQICFKTVLIMSSWQKKLISYIIFCFCQHNHKSAFGLQITDQSRDITSRHHLTRGIAGPNFNSYHVSNSRCTLKELIYVSPKFWKKNSQLFTFWKRTSTSKHSFCKCIHLQSWCCSFACAAEAGAITPALIHHSLIPPIQLGRL